MSAVSQRMPYQPNEAAAWPQVQQVTIEPHCCRTTGDFGAAKSVRLQPDIVIDISAYVASVQHLVEALRRTGATFSCTAARSGWHGPSVEVPTTEMPSRADLLVITAVNKAAIETYLFERGAAVQFFAPTILHPGHIVALRLGALKPSRPISILKFLPNWRVGLKR